MSNLEPRPREAVGGGPGAVAVSPVRELLAGRSVVLGGARAMEVTRTLPHRRRPTVGAWCFVDDYGPVRVSSSGPSGGGMRVPPHPHTGLQTVTWLVDGEILHRDSLGNTQRVRPGQLNLMTAGRGISHSEESPREHSGVLRGVQLWVALPDAHRDVAPHFEHHAVLPTLVDAGVRVTVLMGELGGTASAARTYSRLVGAEVALDPGAVTRLSLEPGFEYGAVTLSGSVNVDGVSLSPGSLLYLGCGRGDLRLAAAATARLLLLGGEPYDGQLVMWWNFVGRSHEDIVAARDDWMAGRRFGEVHGYDGDPLPAPPMPTSTLKPRGRP